MGLESVQPIWSCEGAGEQIKVDTENDNHKEKGRRGL